MRVDLFDFELPPELIALRPARPRDAARMLVVPGHGAGEGDFADRTVADLPDLLRAGDVLVFNDTRVIPARLEGYRVRASGEGARIGATLHKRIDLRRWQAFVRNARRLAIDLPEPAPQGDAFPPPPGPRGRPHAMKRHGPGHPHGPGRGPDAGLRPHDGPPSAGFFGWFENVVDADAGKLELEKSGYTDVTLQEERRHDADFTATGPDGKLWLVKVDAADAIVEREPYQPLPDEAAAKAAIEKLGLKWTGGFTERKHHVEADAATADGKSLVVELNPDGSLRKERF